MPDILLLLMLGAQKKQIGNLKWFAKNMIKYVPGVGWGMVFLDCIFLKRNWAADRSLIQASFAKYLREKIPFWLILFPEGTRLRKHKLKRAAEFAASRGLRPPRHVLLPKPRGFAAALTGLRSEIRAVYDVTIAYNGGVPTLMQLLNGAATGARMNVRRFPVEMLPTDEREIAEWLRIRFVEKDQLLSELLQQDPGI
ncbi:MAG: hypothetical protein A2X97_11270 [Bdellovibrionales bacterium GWA1_52_35]|nr:MAG: hypothetical protein A2X97_11270 [Bdellovibrionales bacterium GWA1_52_35]